MTEKPTKATWKRILSSAFDILDDLQDQGHGKPPFVLGGGTVLMMRFKHRLSKDIDLFTHDAQWITLVSPRLNPVSEAMARTYDEQANVVKIAMLHGDIDFIASGQVIKGNAVCAIRALDRDLEVDTTAEILAKKAFYRASAFKPRDVYDMSASIDLDPSSAASAIRAASSKAPALLRRLKELGDLDQASLLAGIVPYEDALPHADRMVKKVADFISQCIEGPDPTDELTERPKVVPKRRASGWER